MGLINGVKSIGYAGGMLLKPLVSRGLKLAGKTIDKGLDVGGNMIKATGKFTGTSAYKGISKLGKQFPTNMKEAEVLKTSITGAADDISNLMVSRTEGKLVKKSEFIDGKKAFRYVEEGGENNLSGLGKMAVFGASLYAGSKDLYTKEKAERMGQIDEKPRTATPIFGKSKSIGPLDGGADGSLVFALHRNR